MQLIIGNRALSILYEFLLKYNKDNKYTLLLPTNICHDVFFMVLYLKIPYTFIDINNEDFCMNKSVVIDLIKRNKKLILLFNHTYGTPESPYSFFKEIKQLSPNAVIVDDRCLCSPTMKTRKEDECIDLIIYSTGHAKQVDLSSLGYGYVSSPLDISKQQLTFDIKSYSKLKNAFHLDNFSQTLKITDITSCIQFQKAINPDATKYESRITEEKSKWEKNKTIISDIYKTSLPHEIQLPQEMNNWRFNIIIKKKERVLKELFKNGLFASSHFVSIGNMLKNTECQIAYKLHQSVINLFVDKYYTPAKAEKTVEIINRHIR